MMVYRQVECGYARHIQTNEIAFEFYIKFNGYAYEGDDKNVPFNTNTNEMHHNMEHRIVHYSNRSMLIPTSLFVSMSIVCVCVCVRSVLKYPCTLITALCLLKRIEPTQWTKHDSREHYHRHFTFFPMLYLFSYSISTWTSNMRRLNCCHDNFLSLPHIFISRCVQLHYICIVYRLYRHRQCMQHNSTSTSLQNIQFQNKGKGEKTEKNERKIKITTNNEILIFLLLFVCNAPTYIWVLSGILHRYIVYDRIEVAQTYDCGCTTKPSMRTAWKEH